MPGRQGRHADEGTRVNVPSCAASWCRVTVTGKTGYVAQAYLK
ncbi:SH3 domain-containing protein [uncultured Deinococcus sp.]